MYPTRISTSGLTIACSGSERLLRPDPDLPALHPALHHGGPADGHHLPAHLPHPPPHPLPLHAAGLQHVPRPALPASRQGGAAHEELQEVSTHLSLKTLQLLPSISGHFCE